MLSRHPTWHEHCQEHFRWPSRAVVDRLSQQHRQRLRPICRPDHGLTSDKGAPPGQLSRPGAHDGHTFSRLRPRRRAARWFANKPLAGRPAPTCSSRCTRDQPGWENRRRYLSPQGLLPPNTSHGDATSPCTTHPYDWRLTRVDRTASTLQTSAATKPEGAIGGIPRSDPPAGTRHRVGDHSPRIRL